jgi:hypothetical protein
MAVAGYFPHLAKTKLPPLARVRPPGWVARWSRGPQTERQKRRAAQQRAYYRRVLARRSEAA